MALGQLVVRLGLDAVDFTQGMTRAEAESQRLAKQMATDLGNAIGTATIAFTALAAAGVGAFKLISDTADSIAKFQDLAEKVGDTAENFASLKLASDVSGVSLDGVAAASVKLTTALSKTDAEGQGAAKAIKALGLNFDDFKSQSPADQMETVAKSLAGFEDGATKTAVAVALFGKAGADLLPFLNDLADGSERQISLTADQIKAANDFSESMAKLGSEMNTLKQQLVAQLIPTLSDLAKLFTQAGDEADASGKKAQPFAGVMSFIAEEIRKTVADTYSFIGGIKQLGAGLSGFVANVKANLSGNFEEAKRIATATKAEIASISKEYAVLANTARAAGNVVGGSPLSGAAFGEGGGSKKRKPLVFSGIKDSKGGASKGDRTETEKVTEAQRLLESLEKQLQVAEKLTVEERLQQDLLKGKIAGINPVIEAQLLGVARQIDAEKARGEATKQAEATARQELEETQRTYEDGVKARQALEAEAQVLRESVKTDLQIFTDLQAKFNGMVEAGLISQGTAVLLIDKAKKGYEATLRPLGEYTELAKTAGATLVDGLAGAIVQGKSLADVFKNVVKQLAQMILKALLFKALEIGLNGVSAGLGTAVVAGARAGGGNVNQNSAYLVGEKGAEVFVPKQSGSIIPNNQLNNTSASSKQASNVYNISAGGVSREEFMAGLNRTQAGAVSDVRQNRLRRRA